MAQSIVSWTAVLLASNASGILWDLRFRAPIPRWIMWAQVGSIAGLTAAAYALPALHGIRGFLLALTAFGVGHEVVKDLERTETWARWGRRVPQDSVALADALARCLPAILMGVVVVWLGISRRELFLFLGRLGARDRTFGTPLRWTVLGPVLAALFAFPLAARLKQTLRPDFRGPSRALPSIPKGLTFAAINALSEEFQFRAAPLALLSPHLGSQQAMWMTVVLFGLGHWWGQPSGPTGVLMAGFAGWVWGHSMLDTSGVFWAWLIHGIQDVLIFAFLVAGTRNSRGLGLDRRSPN